MYMLTSLRIEYWNNNNVWFVHDIREYRFAFQYTSLYLRGAVIQRAAGEYHDNSETNYIESNKSTVLFNGAVRCKIF